MRVGRRADRIAPVVGGQAVAVALESEVIDARRGARGKVGEHLNRGAALQPGQGEFERLRLGVAKVLTQEHPARFAGIGELLLVEGALGERVDGRV